MFGETERGQADRASMVMESHAISTSAGPELVRYGVNEAGWPFEEGQGSCPRCGSVQRACSQGFEAKSGRKTYFPSTHTP